MAGQLPWNPSQHGTTGSGAYVVFQSTSEGSHGCAPRWYFSRQEIEEYSPSRKDGIDYRKESQLRKFYCSFIQELGMKLRVPQLTIATAMILCHRFYMHQSHAKNEWQTIASVCMFLASKVEETPRLLKDVVVVAYETINKRDPTAAQRIKQKEVYEKQKELIVIGERLLLATIAFDLNIQHPYKPLVAALKRLKTSHNDLVKVAWNFVNDWLWTTLCLQYKPHYIAAGSLYLAAKFHKVKLPAESGKAWWLEFDVSPLQLEEVIQQMLGMLEQKRRPLIPSVREKAIDAAVVGKAVSCGSQSCILSASIGGSVSSQGSNGDVEKAVDAAVVEKAVSCCSQSCILSASIGGSVSSQGSDGDVGGGDMSTSMKETYCSISEKGEPSQCRASDCGSMNSVVEDGNTPEVGEVQPTILESDQISSCKIVSVNVGLSDFDKVRMREALKRRRSERAARMAVVAIDDDDDDAWIEREVEKGVEVETASAEKRQKLVL